MATRAKTTLIVVHVTATPPSANIGAKEVDAMHRAQGWSAIGYHYVIRRSGKVEPGRAEDQVGAHVAGFNSTSIGVSMVGGVDEAGKPQDNRTPAQTAALEKLLRELCARYPAARICGHRDLSPDRDGDGVIEPGEWIKACPCFDAIPWAKSVGLPAAKISGRWDDAAEPTKPTPKAPDARTVYLQKLLMRGGYSFGGADGLVGKKTAAAIRQFQTMQGLPKTGGFDAATVKRLRAMFETAKAA